MGAGVAVSGEHVLTAHYIVLGASHVELVGLDGRTREVATCRARPRERPRARSPSGAPTSSRRGSGRAPAAPGRSRLPAHLHRREGTARRERARLLRRAVRGVLGVHARPRDHDHDGEPRPRGRAAVRRALPPGRRRLARARGRRAASAWRSRWSCSPSAASGWSAARTAAAGRAARLARLLPAGERRRHRGDRRRAERPRRRRRGCSAATCW